MKKLFIAALVLSALIVSSVNSTEAAEVDHRAWTLVQVSYEVQQGDTLDSVTEMYMKKNSYGKREFKEFREGIKQLNDWLLERDMKEGDVLRINYWEKVKD